MLDAASTTMLRPKYFDVPWAGAALAAPARPRPVTPAYFGI